MKLRHAAKIVWLASTLMALAFAAQSQAANSCNGMVIDHSLGANLQLLNLDGTPAETLSDAGQSHALLGQLKVYDCNAAYFAVLYQRQKRLVARGDIEVAPERVDKSRRGSEYCKPGANNTCESN